MSTQQLIQHHQYSMRIAWSDEDQAQIVSFPEWQQAGYIVHTHGDSYAEAVEKGQEMLTFLIDSALEEGEPLPAPRTFASVYHIPSTRTHITSRSAQLIEEPVYPFLLSLRQAAAL